MIVTTHAIERGKERLGLSKGALRATALKALCDGLGRPQTHGQLRGYLDAKRREHQDGELFLYGEQVFIFVGNLLITCWQLPQEVKAGALSQWRKWREGTKLFNHGEHREHGGAEASEDAEESTVEGMMEVGRVMLPAFKRKHGGHGR